VSTVGFNYNPANLGSSSNYNLNCTYLIPNSMSRTTSDGTVTYTWTHTSTGNSTTKVDVGGNKTIYTFNSTPILTQVLYFPNTGTVSSPTYSSTAMRTDLYCYNGNSTSCATATVTLPVAEVDEYVNIGVTAGTSRQQRKYDKYGNMTYSAQYDFGGTSPITATTIVYGTSNGSGSCSSVGNNVNNKPCTVVTTVNGNTVASAQYAYDAHGNLLKTYVSPNGGTSFLSNSTSNVYNSNGTASKTYDLANNETDYTYSSSGYSDGCGTIFPFPIQVKNVTTGLYTSATYDCTGGVKLTSVDASGNKTTYGYQSSGGTADPWWRLRSGTDPLSNEAWITPTVASMNSSFEFNSSNSINNVTTTLDGYGRPINSQKQQSPTTTNYDTVSTTYNFGGVNPTVNKSTPCTASSGSSCGTSTGVTNAFDMLGRLVTSVDGGGGTDTITYTQNDVLNVLGPAPSGENAKQVQSQYDGLGRLTSSCAISFTASGNVACNQNTGSNNGILTTTSYTSGTGYQTVSSTRGSQTRSKTVDGLGRMTQKVSPEGGTWNYHYDSYSSCPTGYKGASGQLTAFTDPNGNLICYAYDSLNRVTGVNANGTSCRHFYYDNSAGYSGTLPTGVSLSNQYGRLVEAATDACSSGTLITDEWFNYDTNGHMLTMWESTPNSGGYYKSTATFYGNGAVDTLALSGQSFTTTYGLDGEGRASSLSIGSATAVSGTTFFPATLTPTISIGTGTDNDAYTIDANTGRTTGYKFTLGSTTDAGVLTWNANGTLKQLAIADGFNSGGTQTCTVNPSLVTGTGYDDLGRLIGSSCGTSGSIWNQADSYDQYDNLTKSSTGFVSWNPTYSTSPSNNHYACTGCTYDSDGDVTNDGTNAYTWNEFSKLASSNKGGTNCASAGECVVYDALGRIVEIDSGSTHTSIWYTQLGKTAYMNGSTYLYSYWPAPGGATAIHNFPSSGTVYIMHKDWLGNARLGSNLATTVIDDYAFAPYGEKYDIFGSTSQNETMFIGLTQDVLAGMYDTPNRELQGSQQGRWLSPDPAGAGWNQYAYVTNPNSQVDPSGLCVASKIGALQKMFCSGGGGNPYAQDESMPDEYGNTIFDAIEGAPGTYLSYNSYGVLSFGFSEDLWVQAENFMDQSNASLAAAASAAAAQGMTLQWDQNPILTVYVHDFGVYTVSSGLIADSLQLQADQQWINSQLSPKEQGFFAVGLVAPSLLIDGNPRAYLLPFIAAYGNEVENYTNEFNTVYDVTAAAKP